MTAPSAPWTEPCDHPNWRDTPDELDALCEDGARQLHGRTAIYDRDITTITLEGGLL